MIDVDGQYNALNRSVLAFYKLYWYKPRATHQYDLLAEDPPLSQRHDDSSRYAKLAEFYSIDVINHRSSVPKWVTPTRQCNE